MPHSERSSIHELRCLVTTVLKKSFVHGRSWRTALREHLKSNTDQADIYYHLPTLLQENSEPQFRVMGARAPPQLLTRAN